ncbi:MAG: hypothetical protein M1812_001082 [Candelaria pacifica]|nr:MAG: hypothetical protein M1812_001082 [Candelaria pacifica]
MGKPKGTSFEEDPFSIHNDTIPDRLATLEGLQAGLSKPFYDVAQSDDGSELSDDSNGAVDASVAEDMQKFEATFSGITSRFRLINRIGEGLSYPVSSPFVHYGKKLTFLAVLSGTFSTVYKAEDLRYDEYDNDWDLEEKESSRWASPPFKRRRTGEISMQAFVQRQRRGPQYVAIKKIYVTSSPMRIQNELELLNDLKGCESVCPLIEAFRHQDQVVAVLPYFRHEDFRNYFREFTLPEIRIYFKSLFTALAAVHKHDILHRDIKPTQKGVLVDFGLAERQGTDCSPCLCDLHPSDRRDRIEDYQAVGHQTATGYPKNDSRPSRRANRAGTRGFRAPEVLLKCTSQTTSIDIWSAGVILLTILSRRFPFFNSADDIEAMIEIATIFGRKRMKGCALLHGTVFECTIPSIGENGFALEKIVLWSTSRSGKDDKGQERRLGEQEAQAVKFMARLFELDPAKRITAREALDHEFLAGAGEDASDEDVVEML